MTFVSLNTYSFIPKLGGRKNWNWHFSEITADCDHTEVCDLELSLGASFVKRIQDIFIEKVQQTWTNNCVTTIKLHTFYAICGPPIKAVVHPNLKLKEGAIKKIRYIVPKYDGERWGTFDSKMSFLRQFENSRIRTTGS